MSAEWRWMTEPLQVLYEDNHLLVINKAAGVSTMGAESGPSAHRMAAEYLRRKYSKPGRVFVGIVSRLDVVTSGVLVLARTSKAASRLVPQFCSSSAAGGAKFGTASKFYLAAIEGEWSSPEGELVGQIWKDDAAHRMRVSDRAREGSKVARLRYWILDRVPQGTILAVELLTGRKHQIRAQFAEHGHPVWGDRKYGSSRGFPNGAALHSWRLRIEHPTRKMPLTFIADPPASWSPLRVGPERFVQWRRQMMERLPDWTDASL